MASEVKWIKIVTDIFDDEKILLIEALPEADSIIVIWFKMLCLAGKLNSCGVLILNNRIAYTEEMLSQVFRRPLNVIRLALTTFERFGMIEVVNDTITIPNWEKHQNIEGMERIRELNRKRQKEWYDRQKALPESSANVIPNVRLTQPNATDIDKDIEIEKENNNLYIAQKAEQSERIEQRFAQFWEAYGVKKDKKRAKAKFLKIAPDEELFKQMMEGLERYQKSRKWLEGYRQEPTTWLNGERWNDEYDDESEVRKREEHRRNCSGNQRESHTDYGLQPEFVDINARF